VVPSVFLKLPMKARLRPPDAERHPRLGQKEALDSPASCCCPAGQDRDRRVVGRVAPHRLGDTHGARVLRYRQGQRHGLHGRQKVDQETGEPSFVWIGEIESTEARTVRHELTQER
jgi:hypothetical protein